MHRPARSWGVLATVLCLCAAVFAWPAAAAGVSAQIYRVAVPVTDRSESSRMAGFQAAMQIALVRATGNRAAGTDPGFAPLVSAADRYVQQYRYAPDGRLWVGFDGAAIERWLTNSGAPLWGRTRPLTYVLLTVANGSSGSIVTADQTSDLKTAIEAEADVRGIELVWPTAADLTAAALDYPAALRADPRALAPLAARHGAEGVLIGHASDAGAAAGAQWVFEFDSQLGQASGPLAGVDLAADRYAATFAVRGAYSPVGVSVAGVRDLADYARVQHLFESLTPVSRVAVTALHGDRVRFDLVVRGGAAPLQRTLALNGELIEDGSTSPTSGGSAGAVAGTAVPELRYRLRR